MTRTHRASSVFLALLIVIQPALAQPALSAGPGDQLEQLTPEQADVARRMLSFIDSTEKSFWLNVDRINRSDVGTEQLVLDVPDNGHYEVRVKRGKVAEKAGVMVVTTQVEKPPFVMGGRWNRFLEMAIHPKNPRVGMLHATFVVQISDKGEGTIGATMDMMKVNQPAADLAFMDARVAEVFTRHNIDRERWRSKACNKPNSGPWKWHRDGTCTGVSMYGAGMLADDKTYTLVSELYMAVIDAYFEILEKRTNASFSADDLAAQDFMRRRWLEDQLFWDVLAKSFVPYEAWSAVNAPPVVKY
jgi:coproporphyrinogen III oxidase